MVYIKFGDSYTIRQTAKYSGYTVHIPTCKAGQIYQVSACFDLNTGITLLTP